METDKNQFLTHNHDGFHAKNTSYSNHHVCQHNTFPFQMSLNDQYVGLQQIVQFVINWRTLNSSNF